MHSNAWKSPSIGMQIIERWYHHSYGMPVEGQVWVPESKVFHVGTQRLPGLVAVSGLHTTQKLLAGFAADVQPSIGTATPSRSTQLRLPDSVHAPISSHSFCTIGMQVQFSVLSHASKSPMVVLGKTSTDLKGKVVRHDSVHALSVVLLRLVPHTPL